MSSKTHSVVPNQTLYIKNLPEKLQKQDLRRELYMLFATHGTVLSIVALKTAKMRGQAHVTYRDVHTATQAMRSLENFDFFGRSMIIAYAKTKSAFIARLDGSLKIPTARNSDRVVAPEAAAGDKGTALQQSVFGGLTSTTQSTMSVKRARDDAGYVSLDEDEGEEMEMDESDDD